MHITSATGGTGIVYLSRASEFILPPPHFYGIRLARYLVSWPVFWRSLFAFLFFFSWPWSVVLFYNSYLCLWFTYHSLDNVGIFDKAVFQLWLLHHFLFFFYLHLLSIFQPVCLWLLLMLPEKKRNTHNSDFKCFTMINTDYNDSNTQCFHLMPGTGAFHRLLLKNPRLWIFQAYI